MLDDDEMFLLEGIRRVGDILATVDAFQRRMVSRIENVLNSSRPWPSFERAGEKVGSQVSLKGKDPWLSAWVEGKINGYAAQLGLGVWWNSPTKDPSILYGFAWDIVANRPITFDTPAATKGIEVLKKRWLYVVPPSPPAVLDLDHEGHRLIDALLENMIRLPSAPSK
jgi:hypothetical protein